MNREHTEKLFLLIKQGDNSVLETIYLENRNAFLNFGLKYTLDKDAILDIYQDAIVAFNDNIVNGKVTSLNSSIKTYLFSIGKYMIYKKLKKQNNSHHLPLDDERLEDYISLINTVNSNNEKMYELIEQAIEQLGKQCQTVLKLYYYKGQTLEDIQKLLNYGNYNTIKSQKSRCLKTLRNLINNTVRNE